MGNVSDSRRQILLNTLEDELSKNFNTSPSKQTGVSKLEVVENTFQLQIVEDEGDTQITLRWIYREDKRVESEICGGCRTIELNESLKVLVKRLFGVKNVVEEPVVEEKSQSGVLYWRRENGELGWFKNGDQKTDGKYVGEIRNGFPNGQGIFTWSDGVKYVGEWKNGKQDGQGTETTPTGDKYVGEWKDGNENGHGIYTYSNGRKYEGEWKDGKWNGQGTSILYDGGKYEGEFKEGKRWNGTQTDKDGNIRRKYVNGIKQ